ncbi:hypothetical protein GUJ93_ZPchr0002g25711 [Zizania palustris]|uniref:Uncharacterized protein n=1 Tax=Zizania palustris TaxID=103762 RepID=A0A8J5S7H0_ZIZPA|nr:hypothetical protein GUJ93_ZPchr0002g25711 [Zizania palustris]
MARPKTLHTTALPFPQTLGLLHTTPPSNPHHAAVPHRAAVPHHATVSPSPHHAAIPHRATVPPSPHHAAVPPIGSHASPLLSSPAYKNRSSRSPLTHPSSSQFTHPPQSLVVIRWWMQQRGRSCNRRSRSFSRTRLAVEGS